MKQIEDRAKTRMDGVLGFQILAAPKRKKPAVNQLAKIVQNWNVPLPFPSMIGMAGEALLQ